MTAEELISGLRERGYTIRRSSGLGFWTIIPRLKPDDPAVPWLREKGATLREFQPERWSNPDLLEYEAVLDTFAVELAEVEHETPAQRRTRKREAIWKAAA